MTAIAHTHAHDARSRRDPTGTRSIRAAFRDAGERRLQKVKNALRYAFNEQNVLGLRNAMPSSYMPMMDMASRVRMFHTWFNEEAYRTLVERDAAWTRPFVQQAYVHGLQKARQEMGVPHDMPIAISMARGRLGVYREMAYNELTGITDHMVQQTNRMAADACLHGADCAPTCRQCIGRINKVTRGRMQLFTDSMVVRAHNEAKLEQYAANGVKRVGMIAETLPRKKLFDAHVHDQDDDPLEGRTPLYLRPDLIPSVELLTAQDDLVCEDCQSLADSGPYDIEDVYGAIPVHPSCRCTWVPYGDERLEEEFSE